jgi:arylsulfatase A-like enzyme
MKMKCILNLKRKALGKTGLIGGTLVMLLNATCGNAPDKVTPRNVLFIAVDDLRCELGCYGSSFIKTPNMDRLAARGSVFTQSYCQMPLCGPSRASLMTGRYPETLNTFWHGTSWRAENPDVVTLSQHFKQNGYTALAAGKIFHNNQIHQDAASWSDPELPHWDNPLMEDYRNPENLKELKEVAARGSQSTHDDYIGAVPPFEKQRVADEETTDGRIARIGIERLKRFKNSGEPFFLALGFHKPHLSFNAPEKYWDLYDRDELPLAPNPLMPEGYSTWYYNSDYFRKFKGMPGEGPFPEETARILRHAYFACVSFVDAQIGKVLDELERLGLAKNTVVVLWGDHGYLLNDHGIFGKHNHFEQALHAPLIMSAPGLDQAVEVSGPVEFIDIYPTVCELAGLPVPDGVEGRSQVQALRNGQSVRESAYSVYGDPRTTGSRSIRKGSYRYVEWIRNGERIHRVLFNYDADPLETRNLVDEESYAESVKALEQAIRDP